MTLTLRKLANDAINWLMLQLWRLQCVVQPGLVETILRNPKQKQHWSPR